MAEVFKATRMERNCSNATYTERDKTKQRPLWQDTTVIRASQIRKALSLLIRESFAQILHRVRIPNAVRITPLTCSFVISSSADGSDASAL